MIGRHLPLALVGARGLITAPVRRAASTPRKTTADYNRLLAGYARSPGRRLADARHLFDRIPEPDVVSYNTLLSCHLVRGDVAGARELFSAMPARDVASWNTMVSGLSRNGAVEEARAVFLAMPARNSVSWNAMVSGFASAGDMGMAEDCFRDAPEKEDAVLGVHGRWQRVLEPERSER